MREILIQGRLYISENYLCFHANIFGWITNVRSPALHHHLVVYIFTVINSNP